MAGFDGKTIIPGRRLRAAVPGPTLAPMRDRATVEEARFRAIFRRAHADHPGCAADEWLMRACAAERSLVWSRRNGPWRRVEVLWVGAAPGNAGGMGGGDMGAHATRIPFGGDIAGANLDHLLASVGLDRNSTFIVASLNQLPDRGGGEPRVAELARPVGDYATSAHLLRDTILATGPRLVVALGNVGLRTTVAAARLEETPGRLVLPGLARLEAEGLARGRAAPWPAGDAAPDAAFLDAWREANGSAPLPRLLWLLHPSAQNMSPHAGRETAFHRRMVDTRAALRKAIANVLGRVPEATDGIPVDPDPGGVYGLPEWRHAVGPRHLELIALWREKGL